MQERTDNTRKLIEAAISAGRHFQSSQTGFVHYCHAHATDLVHYTIPIYDNVLFALALLRSRLIENVREAQGMLTRLTAFQTQEGNFPLYLHDFPWSNDFSLAVKLLTPFYWILKDFGHILGQELRSILESSIKKLIVYVVHLAEVKTFHPSFTVRLAANLLAFGRFFANEPWQQKGKLLLNETEKQMTSECWLDTRSISDILIAFSQAKEDFDSSLWHEFYAFVLQTWQAKTGTYCGPCIYEHQKQFYPALNLYELYMGEITSSTELRLKQPCIEMLEAALIYPLADLKEIHIQATQSEGFYHGANWLCVKNQEYGLSLLEKKADLDEKIHKTYTPFHLVWGDVSQPHSFVCQGGNARTISYHINESIVELNFDLNAFKSGDYDVSREICFFLDMYPELLIEVENQRTSVFDLGQIVEIHLKNKKTIKMSFEIIEGKGQFLGHVAQFNRFSQLKQSEANKFHVYDWTIFLRTLRRSDACKIKVKIDLSSLFESQ